MLGLGIDVIIGLFCLFGSHFFVHVLRTCTHAMRDERDRCFIVLLGLAKIKSEIERRRDCIVTNSRGMPSNSIWIKLVILTKWIHVNLQTELINALHMLPPLTLPDILSNLVSGFSAYSS